MTILDLCLFIANFSFKSSITGLKLEVTELRKQMACCIQLSHPCLAASIACQSLYYCIPSPWQDINTAWPSYLRLHGAQLVLSRWCLWRPGHHQPELWINCRPELNSAVAQLESSVRVMCELDCTIIHNACGATTTTSHWAAAWAKNQLPARAQQWLTWRAQGDLWETWTWT